MVLIFWASPLWVPSIMIRHCTSCASFHMQHLNTFLEWCLCVKSGGSFIFAEMANSGCCQTPLNHFVKLTGELRARLVDDKSEGPEASFTFLGIQRDISWPSLDCLRTCLVALQQWLVWISSLAGPLECCLQGCLAWESLLCSTVCGYSQTERSPPL